MKELTITYEWWTCTIMVDTQIFTPKEAEIYLSFFDWDWDEEGDLILEYCKKIAKKVIELSIRKSDYGVKSWFKDAEGYPALDGSKGIELKDLDEWEFDEESIIIDEE